MPGLLTIHNDNHCSPDDAPGLVSQTCMTSECKGQLDGACFGTLRKCHKGPVPGAAQCASATTMSTPITAHHLPTVVGCGPSAVHPTPVALSSAKRCGQNRGQGSGIPPGRPCCRGVPAAANGPSRHIGSQVPTSWVSDACALVRCIHSVHGITACPNARTVPRPCAHVLHKSTKAMPNLLFFFPGQKNNRRIHYSVCDMRRHATGMHR